MKKTLKIKMHLWFVRTQNGAYLPNHGMTASFLNIGVEGIETKGRLNSEEFEYLKSVASAYGFILHVDDGDKTETFE